jgi:hypothetical protein
MRDSKIERFKHFPVMHFPVVGQFGARLATNRKGSLS